MRALQTRFDHHRDPVVLQQVHRHTGACLVDAQAHEMMQELRVDGLRIKCRWQILAARAAEHPGAPRQERVFVLFARRLGGAHLAVHGRERVRFHAEAEKPCHQLLGPRLGLRPGAFEIPEPASLVHLLERETFHRHRRWHFLAAWFAQQGLGWDAQFAVQFADHAHGQGTLAVEHLRHPALRTEVGHHVLAAEALLFHAEGDGRQRIRQAEVVVLLFVVLDQVGEQFEFVCLRTAGGEVGVHQRGKPGDGGGMFVRRLDDLVHGMCPPRPGFRILPCRTLRAYLPIPPAPRHPGSAP